MRKILFCLLLITTQVWGQTDTVLQQSPFCIDSTHITHWNGEKYIPVFLKGVNLGVAVPGSFPGELKATSNDYKRWFEQIHAAGINSIRVYTLHFPRFFEELNKYNLAHPQTPLYFFQGVWLEEEVPNYNHDLYSLDSVFSAEIIANVKAVHGDTIIPQRFGKAYGNYSTDASKWCMGYILGREIFPEEVLYTDQLHPNETDFDGPYFSIHNALPTAVWLTKKLNQLVTLEWNSYHTKRPVSTSSWPTLDPIHHPYEPQRNEDTANIDLSIIEIKNSSAGYFASYHAYPYYPDFMNSSPNYALEYDNYGLNSYLGYLKDLKSHYKNFPLIIAEYGTPSSWLSAHYSRSGMDHGGHTENEQAFNALRMTKNIESSQCGGGFMFSWIDEWFKRTWIVDPLDPIPDRRILWGNLLSAEQNFGLIGYEDSVFQWSLWESFNPSDEVQNLKVRSGYSTFEISLELKNSTLPTDTITIGFDTYGSNLGEGRLKDGPLIANRIEFCLQISNGTAKLYTIRAYDTYGIWHGQRDPDQLYRSINTDSGDWRLLSYKNNYGPQDAQYIGNLKMRRGFQPQSSNDAVVLDTNQLTVTIPWGLLQFTDPSSLKVLHDDLSTINHEDTLSEGIHLSIYHKGQLQETTNRYSWPIWNSCQTAKPYFKQSYTRIKEEWPYLPDGNIAYTDYYEVPNSLVFSVDSTEGILSNDIQMGGQKSTPLIVTPTRKGFIQIEKNGAFSYFPDQGSVGLDTLEYVLSNQSGISKSGFVYLTLTGDGDDNQSLINLFPNPTTDFINILAAVKMEGIELYNSNAGLVKNIVVKNREYKLDVSRLPTGVYTLKVNFNDNALVRQIIKL